MADKGGCGCQGLFAGASRSLGPSALPPPNLASVLRLSLGFAFLFAAFMEAQDSSPSLLRGRGLGSLGSLALAAFYASTLLFTWAAPAAVARFGARTVLLVAAWAYVVFVGVLGAAVFAPAVVPRGAVVAMVVTGTAISGPFKSMLWPAQGYLLTRYASAEWLNTYTSCFSLCCFCAGIIGPSLVSTALSLAGDLGPEVAVALLLACVVAALCLLTWLPEPESAQQASSPSAATEQGEADVEAAHGGPSPQRKQEESWVVMLQDQRAWCLISLGVAEGLCINAFVPQVLPEVISFWRSGYAAAEDQQQRHLQLALMCNGCGHLVAGMIYAPLADRFGRRCALALQFACLLAATLLYDSQTLAGDGAPISLPWVLPGSFFLGLGVVLGRIGNSAMTSATFPNCAARAFAMMAIARAFGSVTGFVVLPLVPAAATSSTVPFCLGILMLATAMALSHGSLFQTPSKQLPQEEVPESERGVATVRLAIFSQYPSWTETLLSELHESSGVDVVLVSSVNPAVADLCLQRGVNFHAFPKCSDARFFAKTCRDSPEYAAAVEDSYNALRACKPDVLLTLGFYVLPPEALAIPSKAAINLHPSDLPRYRGAMPLEAHILQGETAFRISVHRTTEVIDDHRYVLAVSEPQTLGARATVASMQEQITAALPSLMMQALNSLRLGGPTYVLVDKGEQAEDVETAPSSPQPSARVPPPPHAFAVRTELVEDPATGTVVKSNAGVLSRARIEWGEDSAMDIERAARAFAGGKTGLYTDFEGAAWAVQSVELIGDSLSAGAASDMPPGTVLEVEQDAEAGLARAKAVTCDRQVISICGRFVPPSGSPAAAGEAQPEVVKVGGRLHSTTPLSSLLGRSGVDRVPGGTRYA